MLFDVARIGRSPSAGSFKNQTTSQANVIPQLGRLEYLESPCPCNMSGLVLTLQRQFSFHRSVKCKIQSSLPQVKDTCLTCLKQCNHFMVGKKKYDIPLSVLRLTKQRPLEKELKFAKGEHGFMWKHTLHTKM